MHGDLHEQILRLIQTKIEGDYWDFKREHHSNKADLLHDILSMANSQQDKDCYIILGVEDKTGTIISVERNAYRRTQQNVIDFLKSKRFAGDFRPEIELHSLRFDGNIIDVIIVFNSMHTPFYLSETFTDHGGGKSKTVHANAIYTRIGDTNTSIDKSADYSQVEYLWKKRLGLHLSPFDKLCRLLEDNSIWEKDEEVHYCKFHPEFTIRFDDQEKGHPEFYSYMMTNENTLYGMLYANYNGTTLYSQQTASLDDGRYRTVIPERGFIHQGVFGQSNLAYRFFVRGTIEYLLHIYLYNQDDHEASIARNEFLEVVLIFFSSHEKTCFLDFIARNKETLNTRIKKNIEKNGWHAQTEPEPAKSVLKRDIATGIALNEMLNEYRGAEKG